MKNEKEKSLPRLIVAITVEKKRKFKIKCVKNNETHQDVLERFVDEYIRKGV